MCIALVVSFDGFPLGYEVFAGNTHDSKTLMTIVNTMEARHGAVGRVWITDRGMASAANLAWLRQTGRRYVIGTPKSKLKKFASELTHPEGWRERRRRPSSCAVRQTAAARIRQRVIVILNTVPSSFAPPS